ncbi:MAG: TlpA disulfide reductase family protein [Burkholderiales bacterium]
MKRRQLVGAGVGIAAAAAGVGWSWRHHAPAPAAAPAAATEADDAPPPSLWDQRLPQPQGGELVMATLRGRPLVVNFWATWCPPCVKELPELDQFAREQAARGAQGWQVVGLAIDSPAAVRRFLAKTPVSFPIGMAGYAGTTLVQSLGNPAGGLPFTVVFDAAGEPMHRKLGPTSLAELGSWVRSKPR